MDPIDLNKLTEDELIDLNRRIIERLRWLRHVRTHSEMMAFKVGDRVAFQPSGRPVMTGIVVRMNQKTVSVVTDAGERWNVAPSLLLKSGPGDQLEI